MEKDDLRKLARNAAQEPFRMNMTVSDYHAAIVIDDDGKESVHLAAIMNISKIDMLPVTVE